MQVGGPAALDALLAGPAQTSGVGAAEWYPGRSSGPKLRGGFTTVLQPIMIPGLRILGGAR